MEPRKSKKCHDAGWLFQPWNCCRAGIMRSIRVALGRKFFAARVQLAEEQDELLACCQLACRQRCSPGQLPAAVESDAEFRKFATRGCKGCCTASCVRLPWRGLVLLTEGVPLQGCNCWTAGCTIACTASCTASCITVFDFFSSY